MGKIFLTQASLPEFEEYITEIKDIWDTHWVTSMGPKHNQFEERLKEYLEVNNVSVFVNGHSALEAVLSVMGIKGEVITTPFTFVSTTHAIVRNGLTPVFCDINKNDFNIDSNKIENLITDKTTAILPVHIFGNPCNVEEIDKIAKKHNLKVIYDAAHAFGVKYKGKSIAQYGDATIFSFHASKVFNSIEGGCVAYADVKLNDILYKHRNFGIGNQEAECIGTNGKMNEFIAAMGLCNLRHIDSSIKKREELAKHYISRLKDIHELILSSELRNTELKKNYAYFPVIVNEELCGISRDEIWKDLNGMGIQALRHFYPLTSHMSCYSNLIKTIPTPNASWVSEHILLLPLYEGLEVWQIDYICDQIILLLKISKKKK
jgi:dTDP-4-amino-4,6-dideoxygalactose transaminase